MAVSHVGTDAWVVSVSAVTPTIPAATADGDLMVLTLLSKYDDAALASLPTDWTDHGPVANTGRSTGNDTGNMRGRTFSKVYVPGDVAPTLNPTPNNVSAAKISSYRVAAGKGFDVAAAMAKDDTVGTPLVLAATSTLGLAAGDVLHVDLGLNGDVVTLGTGTLTVAGATMSAATTNVADASTTSGTDMRMRSVRYTVSSGTATGSPSLSTALAGTTTNAVGVGVLLRIREVTAALPTLSGVVASVLPLLAAAGAGLVAVAGAMAAAAPTLTATGVGTVPVGGSTVTTLPTLSGTVAGTVTDPARTGSLAAILPPLSAAAAGGPTVSGGVQAVLPSLGAHAAGATPTGGSLTAGLPSLVATAAGQIPTGGNLAATLPTVGAGFTATQTNAVSGSATVALPPLSGGLAGTVGPVTPGGVTGFVDLALPGLTAGAAGLVTVSGSQQSTLPVLAAQAGAQAPADAVLAVALPALLATLDDTTGDTPMPPDVVYNLTTGSATASRVTVTGPGRASAVSSKGART